MTNHPFIVRLYFTFQDKENLCIFLLFNMTFLFCCMVVDFDGPTLLDLCFIILIFTRHRTLLSPQQCGKMCLVFLFPYQLCGGILFIETIKQRYLIQYNFIQSSLSSLLQSKLEKSGCKFSFLQILYCHVLVCILFTALGMKICAFQFLQIGKSCSCLFLLHVIILI